MSRRPKPRNDVPLSPDEREELVRREAEAFKAWRTVRFASQAEAARYLGMSREAVRDIECGTASPSSRTRLLMACIEAAGKPIDPQDAYDGDIADLRFRLGFGWNQTEFARLLDINQSALSRLEHGELPRVEQQVRLVLAYRKLLDRLPMAPGLPAENADTPAAEIDYSRIGRFFVPDEMAFFQDQNRDILEPLFADCTVIGAADRGPGLGMEYIASHHEFDRWERSGRRGQPPIYDWTVMDGKRVWRRRRKPRNTTGLGSPRALRASGPRAT